MYQNLKKKIRIYLTFDGLSDQLGKSQIAPYLESFLNDDIDFYIFSLEKKENLVNFNEPNFLKKKNIFWKKNIFSKSKNKIFKFLECINFFIMCMSICRKKNVQIIHCRGLQPGMIGFLLKFIFKAKIIFDMRGFWVDEKLDMGTLNKKKILDQFIYKLLKKFEGIMLKNSEHLVVLTNSAKEYVVKNNLAKHDNITVIPCSVDYEMFKIKSKLNNKKTFFSEHLISQDSIVMTYCGSLSGYYMIDEMLKFYEALSRIKKNVFFLLITKDRNIILDKIESKNYKSKIICVEAEWQNVPFLLSMSSFMVSFIKPTFAKIASSPTKVAEAFALGIPVISNSGIGDLDELIVKFDLGGIINIKNNNYDNFIKSNMDKILTFSKQAIINNSINIFDIKKSKASYKKIYEKLT
jgi:glycosyltransferase involved in cell wall biosynthesis